MSCNQLSIELSGTTHPLHLQNINFLDLYQTKCQFGQKQKVLQLMENKLEPESDSFEMEINASKSTSPAASKVRKDFHTSFTITTESK